MGGRGGGVGKIVKYGGMSNDRSSDKRSHKVRFEQALFEQIGPQLLYGLPVVVIATARRETAVSALLMVSRKLRIRTSDSRPKLQVPKCFR